MNKRQSLIALIVLAAILIVGICIGIGPWLTKGIAERALAAEVQTINQQGLLEARYERIAHNWFGEQGTLTLTPIDPNLRKLQQHGSSDLVLNLNIAYGPIPFAAWSRSGFSLMPVGAVIDARIAGLEEKLRRAGSSYRIHDVVSLNDNNTFELNLAPGEMTQSDNTHMRWAASKLRLTESGGVISGDGNTGELTITRPGDTMSALRIAPVTLKIRDLKTVGGQSAGHANLMWGGMQLKAPEDASGPSLALALGAMRFDLNTRFAQGITVGKADMSLAALDIHRPAEAVAPLLALKNMRLGSVTGEPKDSYTDSTLDWTVADIQIAGQHYAPAELKLRFEHQYVPAIRDLVKALRALQTRMRTQPNVPPQFAMQSMLGILMPPLQQLIEHQPVLRVTRLELGTPPHGALEGKGDARIVSADGSTPSLATLPNDLVAHLALQIPDPLARQMATLMLSRQGVSVDPQFVGQFLDKLQTEGVLRPTDNGYAIDIAYRNGAFLVNGQPFAPH